MAATLEIRPQATDIDRHYACIAVHGLFPTLSRGTQIQIVLAYLADDGTLGPARMVEIRERIERLRAESAVV